MDIVNKVLIIIMNKSKNDIIANKKSAMSKKIKWNFDHINSYDCNEINQILALDNS